MLLWILIAVLYLLAGQVFSLTYVLHFRPAPGNKALLGIMGLFWPVLLIVDIFMSIGFGLGSITARLWERLSKDDRAT